LKPLGILFNAFLNLQLAKTEFNLQNQWIIQQKNLNQIARQQKALEAKAKTIAKTQEENDCKNRAHLEKVRRLNNDRFVRWLDNASWTVQTFWSDTRAIRRVILLHWLVFFPLVGALGIRTALSDRCFHSAACRSVVGWIVER
jgi:hypothetical protein